MEVGAAISAAFAAAKAFGAKLLFSAGMKAGLAAWGSVLSYGGMAASLLMAPPSLGSAVHQIYMQPAGPDAPIPLLFGETRTGGTMTYRDTHRDNIHNTNKSNNLTFESVVSAGPIHSIRDFKVNDSLIQFNSDPMRYGSATGQSMCVGVQGYESRSRVFKEGIYMAYRAGDLNDTRTLRTITGQNYVPNITSDHRMSGLASFVASYILDGSKNLRFPAGPPDAPTVLVKGLLCYDPRKDSTGFGSGSHRANDRSTWEWSDNPYLCALTYLIGGQGRTGKRNWGVGATVDQIDLGAFAYGANVADFHGWKAGGVVTTSDDKEAVLANLLAAGAGQLVPSGFKIGVYVNEPKASVFTIQQSMLVGDQTIKPARPFTDRFNRIVAKYREPNSDYNLISGPAIVADNWQTIDGVVRSTEVSLPMVQSASQAQKMAAYVLVNSREYEVDLTLTADAADLAVGDKVTLNFPIGAIEGQEFIIKTFKWNSDSQTIDLTLVSESEGKHEFALGKTATPPAPAAPKSKESLDPTPPTGWTIVANQVSGSDGVKYPAFVLAGAGDSAIQKIIVEIREYNDAQGPFDNWRIVSEYDPAAEQLIVSDGLSANTAYDVAVSYRSNVSAMTPRLVFENVTSGANEIKWDSDVIVDRPPALVEMTDFGQIKAEFIALQDEADRTLAEALSDLDAADADMSNAIAEAWDIVGRSEVDGLRKAVIDLQSSSPSGQLVGRVEALEVANAAATASIIGLQTAQTTLENDIATKAASSELANLSARLNTAEGGLVAQEGRLTNVEVDLSTKIDASRFDQLEAKVLTDIDATNFHAWVGADPSRFTSGLGGYPERQAVLAGGTVINDAVEGQVYRVAQNTHCWTRGWFPVGNDRVHRVTTRVRVVENGSLTNRASVGFRMTDLNSRNGGAHYTNVVHAEADGWKTIICERTSAQLESANGGGNTHFRVGAYIGVNNANISTPSGATTEIAWVKYEDVTEEVAMKSSITSAENAIVDLQNNTVSASRVDQIEATATSAARMALPDRYTDALDAWTTGFGGPEADASTQSLSIVNDDDLGLCVQTASAWTGSTLHLKRNLFADRQYEIDVEYKVVTAGTSLVFALRDNRLSADYTYITRGAINPPAAVVGQVFKHTFKVDMASRSANTSGTKYVRFGLTLYGVVRLSRFTVRDVTDREGLQSSITTAQNAIVDLQNNKANASVVTSLQSTVGGHTASISSLQSTSATKTELGAKLGVVLNAGKVVGFNLNATQNSSTFDVMADKFRVSNGSTNQVVFETNGNKLLIRNAMIENLTVSKLGDGTLNSQINMGSGKIIFDNGSIMQVQGLGFGQSNQFIEWFGPKMPLANCSKSNAISYKTVTGEAYFGGALSAGVLTTKAATSSLAANAVAETALFGSNGGQIKVTLSYAYSAYGGTQQFTGPWPPAYNNSGSNAAVIKLYRSLNNAAFVEVATLNANGLWSDVGVMDGDYYYTQQNSACSGSLTYTDSNVSTQNRRYRATITSRSVTTYSTQSQNLSVICVEE